MLRNWNNVKEALHSCTDFPVHECEAKIQNCLRARHRDIHRRSGVPRGGWDVQTPPLRNSEGPPQLCQTQPDLRKLLDIAEFRTPTPQDVRKKGSKILNYLGSQLLYISNDK